MDTFQPEAIRSVLESHLSDYLDDLETIVNIDSGTFDKEGVDRVGAILRAHYDALGAAIAVFPHDTYGDSFTATLQGSGKQAVLVVGHMDTVFPAGTVEVRPFRRTGGRALGPGVADMKSGDLNILYAVRALRQLDITSFRQVVVLHNSDEEIGSPSSRELVRAQARQADAVLVLEPGRLNGGVVSARKGIADIRVRVFGEPAHAGVNHEEGRSAVLELGHLIVALESLNGRFPGVTLNTGRVEGGDRINVVPDHAFAHLEVRASTQQSLEDTVQQVRDVVGRRTVAGTRAEVEVEIHHTPMHKTPDSQRLVDLAQRLASAIGFSVADVATGGASDGNTAASAGTPVLDGLGPVGGSAHNPNEYIEVDSIVPRATLLAGLIASVGAGAW